MNKYKRTGWFGESHRHSLASRGVKTKQNYARQPISDVWELESSDQKVSSHWLEAVSQSALNGDKHAQKYLEKVFEEDWARIKSKLETEGSVWYVWWMDGVNKVLRERIQYSKVVEGFMRIKWKDADGKIRISTIPKHILNNFELNIISFGGEILKSDYKDEEVPRSKKINYLQVKGLDSDTMYEYEPVTVAVPKEVSQPADVTSSEEIYSEEHEAEPVEDIESELTEPDKQKFGTRFKEHYREDLKAVGAGLKKGAVGAGKAAKGFFGIVAEGLKWEPESKPDYARKYVVGERVNVVGKKGIDSGIIEVIRPKTVDLWTSNGRGTKVNKSNIRRAK